ncbi:hypothetical protein N9473_03970 [Polaribacter sp.]|jgi:hypothetical protein|nr:hypothetical protein [Polaribacter sp.]
MEKIASLLPFVLMITVIYFTYKFFINKKSQPQNVEELNNQKLWKKARWGLYIVIPFIAVLDILNNDMVGGNKNIIPTIFNFIITKYLMKKIIERGTSISYLKLATAGVSILVFLIQVGIGRLI